MQYPEQFNALVRWLQHHRVHEKHFNNNTIEVHTKQWNQLYNITIKITKNNGIYKVNAKVMVLSTTSNNISAMTIQLLYCEEAFKYFIMENNLTVLL
jgi:hypothetical protein